jgi:hypothetical protein
LILKELDVIQTRQLRAIMLPYFEQNTSKSPTISHSFLLLSGTGAGGDLHIHPSCFFVD